MSYLDNMLEGFRSVASCAFMLEKLRVIFTAQQWYSWGNFRAPRVLELTAQDFHGVSLPFVKRKHIDSSV